MINGSKESPKKFLAKASSHIDRLRNGKIVEAHELMSQIRKLSTRAPSGIR
jgi:hypothetical protein